MSKINRKKFHKLLDGMLDLLEDGSAEEELEEDLEEEAPRKSKKKSKKKSRKSEPEEEPEEDDVSLNQVRKAMRTYSAEYGKDEAKALLEEYGVKTLSNLEEDDYASLLKDIKDAEEEEE